MLKRLLVIGAALAVLLVSRGASAQSWSSGGLLTNPLANAIIADSGAVAFDSARQWRVICSSSVAAIFVIEHRDAANLTNLDAQGFFVPANGTVVLNPDWALVLLASQRLRVRLNAAVTGSVWCSVFLDV